MIALSPFLEQKKVNLSDSLVATTNGVQLHHSVFFRYSVGNDYPQVGENLKAAKKSGQFKNSRFNISGWSFPQADHMVTPGLTISQSLYDIFENWLANQNKYMHQIDERTTNSLYNAVKDHYGVIIPFSIGSLNGKGWSYYNEKKYTDAIQAWQNLVTQYPNFAEGYLNTAKARQKLQLPTEQAIEQFKASLATSVIWTAKQKEGLLAEASELPGSK